MLLDLGRLAETDRQMELTWAVRATETRVFGGGVADQLPARGKLGSDLKALSQSSRLRLVTGFSADRVSVANDAVIAGSTASGGADLGPFDRIMVATGQRPST